jgi:hypothetical protein
MWIGMAFAGSTSNPSAFCPPPHDLLFRDAVTASDFGSHLLSFGFETASCAQCLKVLRAFLGPKDPVGFLKIQKISKI